VTGPFPTFALLAAMSHSSHSDSFPESHCPSHPKTLSQSEQTCSCIIGSRSSPLIVTRSILVDTNKPLERATM
jgi:hypothetical protein